MTGAVTVSDATGRLRLANSASLATFGVDSLAELLRIPGSEERILLRHTDGRPVPPVDRPLVRALSGEASRPTHALPSRAGTRCAPADERRPRSRRRGDHRRRCGQTNHQPDRDRPAEGRVLFDGGPRLRTPLTAIKGYVQILAKQLARTEPPSPMVDKSLATLREQSDRMERLINDCSTLRASNRPLRIPLQRLQPRRSDRRISRRGRTCNAATPDLVEDTTGGDLGRWDRDRLAQVFGNLLTNSIKSSPDGGAITVSVSGPARRRTP